MSFDGALALRFLANTMKSGGTLEEALRCLMEESPEAIRTESAMRLRLVPPTAGVSERAAALFSERDYRLARAALMLAHESGGAVAALLDRCAHQLEDRQRWAQRRKALSAQTVVSAWIVGLTPLVMLVVLGVVAPDYAQPLLATVPGRACLALAALFMIVGLWMVRRLVAHDQ